MASQWRSRLSQLITRDCAELCFSSKTLSLIFIFFNDVSPASCKGEQALNSELSRSIFGILHSTSIPSLLVVRRGIHWQRGGR